MNTATELKPEVLKILKVHVGQQSAIKASEIAFILDLPNDRAIREAIRELRKEGALILSSVKPPHYGYYMAANLQEWIAFRDTNLRPRALDILHTAKAMGQAATREFSHQLAMYPFYPN